MATTCESCNGQGSAIAPGDACQTCRGQGVVEEHRNVKVEIPAGVEDGMRLRIAREGHAPSIVDLMGESKSNRPKTARGDVIVRIRVLPHPSFSRKGLDVLYTASIPLTTAILGGKIRIPTLDDEVDISVPTGTNTGDKVTMSGEGMSPVGSSLRARKGDFKVEFKVQIPKKLTTTNQKILVELLADEFEDKGAKRTMNVRMDQLEKESDSPKYVSEKDSGASAGETKKHDGFLKNLFTKLTHHQPKKPSEIKDSNSSNSGSNGAADEGRKASGSGS